MASKINQLSNGGKAFIITKIIINDKNALKELVLIFLFNKSNCFIPEYSILIKCKPIKPKTSGKIKLIELGKNDVRLTLKNELYVVRTVEELLTRQCHFLSIISPVY